MRKVRRTGRRDFEGLLGAETARQQRVGEIVECDRGLGGLGDRVDEGVACDAREKIRIGERRPIDGRRVGIWR